MLDLWLVSMVVAATATTWVLRAYGVPRGPARVAGAAAGAMAVPVLAAWIFIGLSMCGDSGSSSSEAQRRICTGETGVALPMVLSMFVPAVCIAAGMLLLRRGRPGWGVCASALLAPILPILYVAAIG